jgi:hypothetical protein
MILSIPVRTIPGQTPHGITRSISDTITQLPTKDGLPDDKVPINSFYKSLYEYYDQDHSLVFGLHLSETGTWEDDELAFSFVSLFRRFPSIDHQNMFCVTLGFLSRGTSVLSDHFKDFEPSPTCQQFINYQEGVGCSHSDCGRISACLDELISCVFSHVIKRTELTCGK